MSTLEQKLNALAAFVLAEDPEEKECARKALVSIMKASKASVNSICKASRCSGFARATRTGKKIRIFKTLFFKYFSKNLCSNSLTTNFRKCLRTIFYS
jgi:hypothetical protein